ncbi:MAG: flagellar basal body-associated protein FliL [Opitutales bacterium]
MADEPQIEEITQAEGQDVQASKRGAGGSPIIPLAVVSILMPLLTFALFEFVLMPRAADKLGLSAEGKGHGDSHAEGHGDEEDYHGPVHTAEFNGIVSNIRGTVGSRYIKVSFTIEGRDEKFSEIVEKNHPRIQDATISILQELTLTELDQPGIKNVVRSDLLNEYASVLKGRVIEKLYFTEFVIQ